MRPASPGIFDNTNSPGGGSSPIMGGEVGFNTFDIGITQDYSDQFSQKSKSTPSTALSGQRRTKTSRIAAVKEKEKFEKEEYARAFFKCECIVCKTQVTHEVMLEEKKKFNTSVFYDEEIQFRDLVEKMFANSDKIKGA